MIKQNYHSCPYGIVLCCYLKRFSFSLNVFSFCSHVQVFLFFFCVRFYQFLVWNTYIVLFAYYFCPLIIVLVFVFMLSVLLLAIVISLSLLFSTLPSSLCIDKFTLESLFPYSFLHIHSLSISSLGSKALCIVINLSTSPFI